jgi:glucose-6-phosphate isomerase
MSDWPPPLVLPHPREAWWLDATTMGLTPARLDALPWARAWEDREAQAAGGMVNHDEGRQVGHTWLRAPEDAPTMGQARAIGESIEAVRAFAREVRRGLRTAPDGLPFTDVIHVGIGGSALGPMLVADALAPDPDEEGPRRSLGLHFIDNTDPDGVARTLARLGDGLRHALVVVVSKSGGTVETRNGLALVREALEARDLDLPSRAVAITVEDSRLDAQAREEGWIGRFPLWDWVGGRFSLTSAVGLLAAELAGIDTQPFLEGAREMDTWTRARDWRDNPAALLAGCWHLAGDGRGARAMVVLPYRDRLGLLARYLQQLVMESLGKRLDRQGAVVEQGLTVYGNKGSTDQHAYVQQLRDGRDDAFVTFVQVLDDGRGSQTPVLAQATAGDTLQGFLLGTRRALVEAGRPCLTLTLPRLDARQLGGLVALFERAVQLYASLVDVNAWHQPGVEAGKKAAGDILELSRRLRQVLPRRGTALELARLVEADPIEIWNILEHLVATGRAHREGPVGQGRYGP